MTPEKKAYFEAVFIGEKGWGPIDLTLAEKDRGMFHCGHCSTEDHKVFHNLIGQHCHISDVALIERIEAVEI